MRVSFGLIMQGTKLAPVPFIELYELAYLTAVFMIMVTVVVIMVRAVAAFSRDAIIRTSSFKVAIHHE